jgi:hypothetical protein
MVRLRPDDEAALAAWIEARPEPKPSRPEAIRELMRQGLAIRNPPVPDA